MNHRLVLLCLAILTFEEVQSKCYTSTISSEARNRIYGPVKFTSQAECELACNCASGFTSDCSSFSSLPARSCLAYSFDPISLKCSLLGDTLTRMCSEPATIFLLVSCSTTASTTTSSTTTPSTTSTLPTTTNTPNPLCGQISLDSKAVCGSTGYTCPAGYLPYLSCLISSEWSYTGGSNIYWSASSSNWIVNYTTSKYEFAASAAQNITCFPATPPTYTACSGNVPRYGNALLLGDSFGCMSGFTWNYFSLVGGNSQSTQPVCTVGGWTETAGGTVMNGKITEMWCKPN